MSTRLLRPKHSQGLDLNKESFQLVIEVTQQPVFGNFELTKLEGPLADKMLCYAMLAEAGANVRTRLERVTKVGENAFRITIEVKRQPDGRLKLERLEGPDDPFFIRGALELARDGVQAGIKGASKVDV